MLSLMRKVQAFRHKRRARLLGSLAIDEGLRREAKARQQELIERVRALGIEVDGLARR
jgi:hypothetical protein